MAPADPDFDQILAEAQEQRRPVPLERARQALGDLFDEADLAAETLFFRGDTFALTPTAWVRVVRRAQAKHESRPSNP